MEITKPDKVNKIPRLKALVFGLNIQKLDTTKKKRQIPKKTFNPPNLSFEGDL